MIRVVDNKKVEMTDDEYEMYNKIVKSYTDITGKGEDLFIDLFESNDDGVIIFLKPPSKRRTSLEVFLFLMAVMQHQHLRLMHQQIDEAVAELKKNNKAAK
jgi:hypothetical protein